VVHVPLMFLSEWREFPLAPCLARGGGGLVDGLRPLVVEMDCVA